MLNKFISLALSLLFLYPAFSQTRKDSSYFPLSVGNQWIYKAVGYTYLDTVTIIDTQRVNHKLYYAFKENYYKYLWFWKDSDKIYLVDTTGIQLDSSNVRGYLIYDFSADTGTTWNMPLTDNSILCEYGGTITLVSQKDSVTTSAGLFTDCYYFSRNVPCADAGRINEWFAAGIGRVAYYEESIAGVNKFFLTYSNIITGIYDHDNSSSISEYKLWQNYPNPFNPTTQINYKIPKASFVTLKVYDILGKEMAILVNEYINTGEYTVNFDASSFSSGVYFYQLKTNSIILTKRCYY